MAFNGTGTFSNPYNWENDAANDIDILASRMDTQDSGIASGLSNCICKDGQQTTTAIIPFSGGGISLAAGTLLAPSCSIIGDSDTGLAQVSGAGTMAFISNGSKILTFSGAGMNGPVGGTTAAAGAFTTINASGILTASSTSTLTGAVTLGSTINKLTLTAPATGSTITITDGKTLKVDNTLEFAGTDSTKMTFPGTTDTVVTLTATQTLTNKTITTPVIASITNTGTITLPTASSTLLGTTTSTLATAGNVALTNGMIMKWGTASSISAGTTSTITFPIAFPTNCFNIIITSQTSDTNATSSNYAAPIDKTSFTLGNKQSNTATFYWQAIGN